MQTQKGDDFMENKELIDKAIEFIQHNPKENLFAGYCGECRIFVHLF